MSKLKILLVGSIGEEIDTLQTKLNSLQSSKAGPFDVCFSVGSWAGKLPTASFPLPVYISEYTAESKEDIVALGNNLFYLQGNKDGVQRFDLKLPNCPELSIATCPRHLRTTTTTTPYTAQCDLLLSFDWPQGMEDVLQVETEPLSYDVAQVAHDCRPRYHVAPSSQRYYQSPPYALPNSQHVGRFLALAPVTPKATKATKFIHALGLLPLSAQPPPTTAPSVLPCPFPQANSELPPATTSSQPTRQSLPEAQEGAYSRFAKKRSHAASNSLEPPEDPSISTLFLYGLHKDVRGELQRPENYTLIQQAFASYGLTQVRFPPNVATSTFCFLEFPNQSMASACLLDCAGHRSIDGVDLTLKWATPNKKTRTEDTYVTQSEAPNSTTLYFHPPPQEIDDFDNHLCQYMQATLEDALNEGNEDERVTAETEPALKVTVRRKDHYGFLEFASHAAATMALAAVTNSTDGGLLVEPKNDKEAADKETTDKEAADKEAADKEAADKEATDKEATDKEATDKQAADKKVAPASIVSSLVGTTLRWAKGEPKPSSARQTVLEALGLERQYFPADTRTDCWFCLASPTCETHLITGVHKEWYAAMPKGPVHPGHVLLVPVTHTGQGAWTLPASSCNEWSNLVQRLQHHASAAYDSDLFLFERAMETKGGYHTHIQCVPIPRNKAGSLQTTLLAHAKACGFELRSIESDLGVDSLIGKGSGQSDTQSYFYAEIRTKTNSSRLLYQHEGNTSNVVPLQFAREVLASVLQNPKLAHWKSCVVDKEQETQLAKELRESLERQED